MKVWQIAERHSLDLKTAKETGCIALKSGFIAKYNGKVFWDVMKSLGHDHTELLKCKCSKPKGEKV